MVEPIDPDTDPEQLRYHTALTFTIACFGNSVTRVELLGSCPVPEALAEKDLPGREDLVYPLTPRIRDAIEAAVSQSEHCTYDEETVCAGFCRYLAEGVTQFTVWLQR